MKIKKFNMARTKLMFKKNGPTICVVTGVAGMAVSAVLACRATLKVKDILEEREKNLEAVETELAKGTDDYTEEDAKNDRRIIKIQTGVKVAKSYIVPVALGVVSATSILYGHNIVNKRNAALGAAYTALDQSYKEYRKKVIETLGEEAEHKMRFGVTEEENEVEVEGKNGKKKTVKETKRVYNNPYGYSPYAKIFDEASRHWQKEPGQNKWFLQIQQNFFNDKLKANGYVFLNDVYKALDIPCTKAGQIVGWVYDPDNPLIDNYIDFGMYDTDKPGSRAFINGYDPNIVLDFNVDGAIIDLIESISSAR